MIPRYNLKPIYNAEIQRYTVGDILAYGEEAVRIISVNIDGTLVLRPIATDDMGNPVPKREPSEDITVKFDDKRLSDIKITRECLLRNHFTDESVHTLQGSDTFRYVNPKDTDHVFHVRIGYWADGTYFDDREYHNLKTAYMMSLRDLQHALTMDRINLLINL